MTNQHDIVRPKRGSREVNPLEGQVAVVTGAGRGIGRGIAEELLVAGARVVISQRSESELRQVAKELGEIGEVSAFACTLAHHSFSPMGRG
jgi:NAD(P)-dependent dehydrogenase (short-subunit alcohol dehydrogenase family)